MADIFPTEEELKLLVTDDPASQWWVLQADGSPPTDLLRPRPADAQPSDVGGMTPWYNNRPHLHDEDHDWPWSIHARGTLKSVRALQVAMLRRIGEPVLAERGVILVAEWTLIFGKGPAGEPLVAIDLRGGAGADEIWKAFTQAGVVWEFTGHVFRAWPCEYENMLLQCALPAGCIPPEQVVVQWKGDTLWVAEGGNHLVRGSTYIFEGVAAHVEPGEA